jgi:hypothetical protein
MLFGAESVPSGRKLGYVDVPVVLVNSNNIYRTSCNDFSFRLALNRSLLIHKTITYWFIFERERLCFIFNILYDRTGYIVHSGSDIHLEGD